MSEQKVFSALSAVQRELAAIGIGKNSTNQEQKFKFRGIDAVYNALAPILGRNQVLIIPHNVELMARQTITTASGKAAYETLVRVTYHFLASDGSCIVGQAIGEGRDNGDKSASKALTMAYKYFLIHSLSIPLEGEIDPDGETPEATQFISVAQALEIEALAAQAGTELQKIYKAYTIKGAPEIQALTEIPSAQYEKIVNRLKELMNPAEAAR